MLEDLGVGVILLLLGFIAGKIVEYTLNKIFLEIELDKNINKIKKQKVSISRGVSSLVALIIYILTIVLFLDKINLFMFTLKMTSYVILFLLIVSFFKYAIVFPSNFMAGFYLRKKLEKNAYVEFKLVKGTIHKIGLVKTVFIFEGDKIVVSNNYVLKNFKSKSKIKT